MSITRQIVALARRLARTYRGTNPARYITIHQTGNTNAGADAQAHANLQSRGNSRSASWHWQVDDHGAIQSYPDTARCWHAGDGKGDGNMSSIAIEICVNRDGDYTMALANTAELVRTLMAEHSIPLERVVQHNHWSGKNCPRQIRAGKAGIDWAGFLTMVSAGNTPEPVAPSKPKSQPTPKPKPSGITEDGLWGRNTTRALQREMGTPVDGEVWNQNRRWKSRNPGLTTGWRWKAWSRGLKGSPVIAAIQRELGVKADGLIGPATINALSERYGVRGDGHIDRPSITVRAMQRALNAGSL